MKKEKRYLVVDKETGEVVWERDTPFDLPKYRSANPPRKYRRKKRKPGLFADCPPKVRLGYKVQVFGFICIALTLIIFFAGSYFFPDIIGYLGVTSAILALLSIACIHIGNLITKMK